MSGEIANARGLSPVARGRAHMPGYLRAAGAMACCALVLGGLAWVVWPRPAREPVPVTTAASAWGLGQNLPERPFRVPPPQPPPAPRPEPVAPVAAPLMIMPAAPAVVAPAPSRAMGFWEDANAIQQAVQQTASRPAGSAGATSAAMSSARPDPDGMPSGTDSDYGQRMRTTRFADAAPVPPRFHVAYTIKKGTIFPCTPSQPISSSLPGPVRCTADQDVWGMDGTTILLPRGTQVNGTVERGLANGEDRLFLVWTDALTPRPDLLVIPLDSPAADEMGQTGVPGDVNDHLWKRIKTALLLSAIDLAGNGATAALRGGRNNTTLNLNGIGGTATTLGQMAFGRDLNIPPTLYRGPGQPLTVYVNHYIDLHRFYRNRVR